MLNHRRKLQSTSPIRQVLPPEMIGKALQSATWQRVFLFLVAVLPIIIFIGITVYDVQKAGEMDGPCLVGQFPCNSNSSTSRCLEQNKWCNDVKDCLNGEDEDPLYCVPPKASGISVLSCFDVFASSANRIAQLTLTSQKLLSEFNTVPDSYKNQRMSNSGSKLINLEKSTEHSLTSKTWKSSTNLTRRAIIDERENKRLRDLHVLTHSTFISTTAEPITFFKMLIHNYTSTVVYTQARTDTRTNRSASHLQKPQDVVVPARNCPAVCLCSSRQIVCINKGLTEVPIQMPLSIESLSLEMNSLEKLKPTDFQEMRPLLKLLLNQNLINYIAPGSFQELSLLTFLDLSHNRIKYLSAESFRGLSSLRCLMLRDNQLGGDSVTFAGFPPSCVYLDLHNNNIRVIYKNTFPVCSELRAIKLSKNSLTFIEEEAFQECPLLQELDFDSNNLTTLPHEFQSTKRKTIEILKLSNNPLEKIKIETISNLKSLTTLNLTGVFLTNLNKEIFYTLSKFVTVEFSSFSMCRHVPRVLVCIPGTDGISSLNDLLDSHVLRICIWIVAVVTCIGNILVMICRTTFGEEKNVHSLFIINLAAADFMLGIYLFVIASHDILYRNRYNIFFSDWTDGWTCKMAGFMGVMSIEVSIFILTSMSFECCLTVCLPLKPRMMTIGRARLILFVMWLVGATIAGIPIILNSTFSQFYGGNGVCLPLYIHDPFMNGWQYSTFIFSCVNVIGMMIIVTCYTIIFCSLRQTRSKVPQIVSISGAPGGGLTTDAQPSRKIQNMDKRLFVIVLTNLICWIPVTVIKFLAFHSIRIPENLNAWLAVFVIPINSALNPIIYSITTPSFRRKLRKHYNIMELRNEVRKLLVELGSRIRDMVQMHSISGSTRPRYMSRISGGTAVSFLGLHDILLLQRRRVSSFNNRNEPDDSQAIDRFPGESREDKSFERANLELIKKKATETSFVSVAIAGFQETKARRNSLAPKFNRSTGEATYNIKAGADLSPRRKSYVI